MLRKLLAFPIIMSNWAFQLSLSSRVTPGYLTSLVCSNSVPSRIGSLSCRLILLLVKATMLVFSELTFNPTSIHHFYTMFSADCRRSNIVSSNFPLISWLHLRIPEFQIFTGWILPLHHRLPLITRLDRVLLLWQPWCTGSYQRFSSIDLIKSLVRWFITFVG